MVGEFTAEYRGEAVRVTLDDELRWHASHPLIGVYLEVSCSAVEDVGPAGGQPGHKAFHDAVRALRGTVTLAPEVPAARVGIIN